MEAVQIHWEKPSFNRQLYHGIFIKVYFIPLLRALFVTFVIPFVCFLSLIKVSLSPFINFLWVEMLRDKKSPMANAVKFECAIVRTDLSQAEIATKMIHNEKFPLKFYKNGTSRNRKNLVSEYMCIQLFLSELRAFQYA